MTLPKPDGHPLRRALGRVAEVKGGGEDCPTPSTIWESANAELSGRRNAEVILHIGECSACGVAWELARDLSEARSVPSEVSQRRPVWGPLAAAAVLAAALAAVWLYSSRSPDVPPASYREPAGAWLVSETPLEAALPRDACVLRWAAGPEGTTYDVTVTDESLQPLSRAWRLDIPEHAIASEKLDDVPSGGQVLWRVTAHLPDGRSVTSLTFINTVE